MLLGEMYSTIEQDYVAAYAWLNLAAVEREKKSDDPLDLSDEPLFTRGNPVAADAASGRDEVAELMTAEQIKEGERMARELWERIEADSGS